jgi:Ca2+-binding EF-hand superfamily protein
MNVNELKFEVSEDIKALLPEPKLTSIVKAFTQLDSNQDGKIDMDEYLNFALVEEKIHLTKTFEALDTDKDGCIEFEEFVVANEPTFPILKRFRELDLDQNGLLSIEEATAIAKRLVLPLSTNQIETIIVKVDRDGDGQISYYEYLGAIAHIGFQ